LAVDSWARVVRVVALVVGLVALAPATATAGATPSGATVFTHSATSGELRGGRLTLRGVSRRVTWVINSGRSGVVSVRRLHAKLFAPGIGPSTGTLHVAGDRGGDEPAFSLSRPRYNASRHTVSYAARALNHRSVTSRTARAAGSIGSAQQFGAASLSIVGAPQVSGGDNGGLDCHQTLQNNTAHLLGAAGESKWDTDTWDPGIPFQYNLDALGSVISWGSDGGLLRGCSNTGVWVFIPSPSTGDPNPPNVTFTMTTTYPWTGTPTNTCTSSDPQDFPCLANGINGAGNASWQAYQPPSQ
jgi:hypothetical protein